jgi:hypothetical protein
MAIMGYALILAGVCPLPPLFDNTGPVCTPLAQVIECECSECFSWAPAPGAFWYEVQRTGPDGAAVIIGTTRRRFARPALWCAPWDDPFPVEGVTYTYRVRSCTRLGCGPWGVDVLQYTAAPYRCYAGGERVPCYQGDLMP